jgi:hypothetical protein
MAAVNLANTMSISRAGDLRLQLRLEPDFFVFSQQPHLLHRGGYQLA